MSNKRKGGGTSGKDFMDSLNNCFNEVKARIRKVERKKKLETKRRKEIQDDYNKWLEKQKPEAEKAAKKILEWVNEFLASDTWREIVSSLRSLKRSDEDGKEEPIINYLDISRTVIYKGPSPNPFYPYGNQGYQSLSIDLAGNLFVHNNVKYGKSYKIQNFADMMQYVDPVVLIEVTKTMQNDSIWAIIQEELKKLLKNSVSRIRDW